MATCPECDAALDLEPEDVDLEDRLSCDDCGASLKVTSIAPLELDLDDDDEDDEDDVDDDDEEEDDDEEADVDEEAELGEEEE
jgi:alpha-aminoadipate carrier protein LysW